MNAASTKGARGRPARASAKGGKGGKNAEADAMMAKLLGSPVQRRVWELAYKLGEAQETRLTLAQCINAACVGYQEVLQLLEAGIPAERITRKVERKLRAAVMLAGCLKDTLAEMQRWMPTDAEFVVPRELVEREAQS